MFLNIMKVIKVLIRIFFYLILIGVCVTSWIKLLKEPTAFEEKIVNNQARLPTFTLCPAQPDGTIGNKSIKSFEDIEKAIENVKDKYTIEYAEQKPYEQTKMVEKKYADTLYGVWKFAPKISSTPPFEAVICLIWTPSIEYKLKPDWSYKVMIHMDVSQSLWYILQFHEKANSPYLYQFAQDQWLWFQSNTMYYIGLGKQIDAININKSNYTCYKDNSNFFMHCMENYYSKKLGCMLPWALKNNTTNDTLNPCEGKEKFKEFRSIAMNILKSETREELINEGCFIPNCKQRSWKVENERNVEKIKNDSLIIGFLFEMPQHTNVLIREEVELYTLINFFAEVGGYLGLLLGESLISYLMTASTWFQILRRKLKEY